MEDIRDLIFRNILNNKFCAVITSESCGIFSGEKEVIKQAEEIGISLELNFHDGQFIEAGDVIGSIFGTPKKIALAEEKMLGCIAKYSGIATAAKNAVETANKKVRIVAGSWKKMPPEIKDGVRKAILDGGASFRICDTPMIYLDKNYIQMLGSIENALNSVRDLKDFTKVVQIKGRILTVEEESRIALENGCGILMVDTGQVNDLKKCIDVAISLGYRNQIKIAFAGNVKIENITSILNYDIDILCIGKDIVDAKLLDVKLDVQ